MPRQFSPATAEQVVGSVEAVIAIGSGATAARVAEVADFPEPATQAALDLAEDLGLLSGNNNEYSLSNPIGRFLVTPRQPQKAHVIRVVLESYEPFTRFRERLEATGRVDEAARQTKALLSLDAHRDEIKQALVNLGTYAEALASAGGGHYVTASGAMDNPLGELVRVVEEVTEATALVRRQLGADAVSKVSEDEVIAGLADAVVKAQGRDPDGAVFEAGNAVESYLERLAERQNINVQGATGINAKLDRLQQDGFLPKKLKHFGKYLGHIRNAADHGVDQDIGAEWAIAESTGLEYIFVACSFIRATTRVERGGAPIL